MYFYSALHSSHYKQAATAQNTHIGKLTGNEMCNKKCFYKLFYDTFRDRQETDTQRHLFLYHFCFSFAKYATQIML